MRKEIYLPLFFILLFTGIAFSQQYAVLSGNLQLDSSWVKKIYISRITDFNLMFTASDKLIVAEGNMDMAGSFSIPIPVTAEETLYRLHVIRKTDPVSTLIIGSEDENHAFFIAKDSGHINLNRSMHGKIIVQANINGGEANTEWTALLQTIKSSNNRDSLKNQLVRAAEHSKSELVGLFAVYSSFGLNARQKKNIRYALKRYDTSNPYGSRIFEEYRDRDNRDIIFLVVFIFISAVAWVIYSSYKKKRIAKVSQSLSQRESNIVRLILEGRTNKEIASELNIELSTVKTHVNNIYAKLKVGNRKELLRYKEIFGSKV